MKGQFYKIFYRAWSKPAQPPVPGYTLLLMMPGDLPFFFEIFLRVFADVKTEHLVETLVIPDKSSPAFRERFARFERAWPHPGLRLVEFKPLDRGIVRALNNPGANNWLQLVNGVNATRSTHALWHDADLFVFDPEFFESHYLKCARDGLACLGVNPAWDRWFEQAGLPHVTATWEMMFEVDWLRRFPPWQHRGHHSVWKGEAHTFDSTLLPQALTPPERVGRWDRLQDFVHFNYVISAYRWFQNGRGSFDDPHFRILFLRLLIDVFDPGGWPYEAPTAVELARGLTDPSSRVVYTSPKARENYSEFRGKIQRLLDSTMLDGDQMDRVLKGLAPFDRALAPEWSVQERNS